MHFYTFRSRDRQPVADPVQRDNNVRVAAVMLLGAHLRSQAYNISRQRGKMPAPSSDHHWVNWQGLLFSARANPSCLMVY
jgi:hypothetical protein